MELEPSIKKRSFSAGRLKSCEIQLVNEALSRIHFTIFFNFDLRQWLILDGGVYPDTKEYQPSSNGLWINGNRLRAGNPEPITPSDKICLGLPKTRIIVGQNRHDTINSFAWEQPGWPEFSAKPTPRIEDAAIQEQLQQLATPTPVGVASDFLDWIQARAESPAEVLWKLFVVLLVGAVVLLIFK
ncbi:MAG: FHA domain-containing protein [Leptolyngbyaceae cyanobacterium RM1_1_2]|nr:FHA domain-containing protein [Leptolyngbyaceae cyanobacterium RM1_1_2]